MKRKVVIEIEETTTETRIVVPGNIHCPACGSVVSMSRPVAKETQHKRFPRIETISISPESTQFLGPSKE